MLLALQIVKDAAKQKHNIRPWMALRNVALDIQAEEERLRLAGEAPPEPDRDEAQREMEERGEWPPDGTGEAA